MAKNMKAILITVAIVAGLFLLALLYVIAKGVVLTALVLAVVYVVVRGWLEASDYTVGPL